MFNKAVTVFFTFVIIASAHSFRETNISKSSMNEEINNNDSIRPRQLINEPFNCTGCESCSYNGICINNTMCYCKDGYTTFNPTTNVQCNYKQVNRLNTLMIEMFLFAGGGGHWYLKNTMHAVGNIIYFFGGLILIYILSKYITLTYVQLYYTFRGRLLIERSNTIKYVRDDLIIIWFIGLVVYWLYEIIMISTGKMTDGNGVHIGSWE